jgi:hypothetical protein
MPQLTLAFDKNSKSLGLSPEKPKANPHSSRAKAYYSTSENNLWKLHHQEEDMAASSKKRAAAQAEGKGVKMHNEDEFEKDENVVGEDANHPENVNVGGEAGEGPGGKGKEHVGKNGDPKGIPTNKKRSRSPEGGGVAGNKSKKHKNQNAYEISRSRVFWSH